MPSTRSPAGTRSTCSCSPARRRRSCAARPCGCPASRSRARRPPRSRARSRSCPIAPASAAPAASAIAGDPVLARARAAVAAERLRLGGARAPDSCERRAAPARAVAPLPEHACGGRRLADRLADRARAAGARAWCVDRRTNAEIARRALPEHEDGRDAPAQSLPQARRLLARRGLPARSTRADRERQDGAYAWTRVTRLVVDVEDQQRGAAARRARAARRAGAPLTQVADAARSPPHASSEERDDRLRADAGRPAAASSSPRPRAAARAARSCPPAPTRRRSGAAARAGSRGRARRGGRAPRPRSSPARAAARC